MSSPDSAPELWLRLDEAAQRLGVTPQSLWARLEAEHVSVRRTQLDGRDVSSVRARDVGLAPLGAAPASPTSSVPHSASAEPEGRTSIWAQIEALRAERDLLEQTLTRVLQERAEREALERTMFGNLGVELDDLRARCAAVGASAQEERRRNAELDARLAQFESELRSTRDERDAARQAGLSARLHADEIERARADELMLERIRRRRLESELEVLRRAESANQRYLDRIEQRLRQFERPNRAG